MRANTHDSFLCVWAYQGSSFRMSVEFLDLFNRQISGKSKELLVR